MTKVHVIDFHYSLFLSRAELWQLLDDPTDFISSKLINGDHTIHQDKLKPPSFNCHIFSEMSQQRWHGA